MLNPVVLMVAKIRKALHRNNIDCQDQRHIWSPGVYIQDSPHIHIGNGCFFGPNVGVICHDHHPDNLETWEPARPVHIGERCWVGMNAVILPGVTLGDRTIVGAGAVVTKSFPEGHCIIAGNPARLIREL